MTKRKHAAFAERLRKALEAAEIEPRPSKVEKALARRGVSVTAQAASGWLRGRYMPKPESMQALAFLTGVEPYLLQFGKTTQGVGEERGTWTRGVGGEDRMAIDAYLALPATRRHLVRELIHLLATPADKRRG